MNIPKELQELRANIEDLRSKYQEVKAMPGEMDNDKMKMMEEDMMRMMNYTHSRITYLEDAFYKYQWDHSKGHLPQVNSPSQMEHCLDILGLGGDYQVHKPMISMASEKYGFEVK